VLNLYLAGSKYKGGYLSKDKKSVQKKANPEKIHVLRRLPQKIKESLTKEEVDAFLFEDVWPDSLIEKLKDYIIEE
jgi:hypothetical protein